MANASYPSILGASIQTAEIDNNAITTAKIAAGAVTSSKIADVAGTQSGVQMPLSTTIGDYTQPTAAVATSEGIVGNGKLSSEATPSTSGSWAVVPSNLTNATDDDAGTQTTQGTGIMNSAAIGYIEFDFGAGETVTAISVKFWYGKTGTGWGNALLQVYDGTWTTIKSYPISASTTVQETVTFASKLVTKARIGWNTVTPNTNLQVLGYANYLHLGTIGDDAYARDDSTATVAKTKALANSNIYADMNSALNVVAVAIYGTSEMTETEIQIRTSTDAAAWTKFRTILTSKIIAGQWNYILLNAVNARYIQVYGSSGSALAVAVAEIKVRTATESQITLGSRNKVIDNSDTALTLAGGAE